jgi:hypothetical protein
MILGITKGLAFLGTGEPDPASTPNFSAMKPFMFDCGSFQGLKDKVSNFARNPREYIGEAVDIMSKSVHPPVPAFAAAWESETYETFLRLHLEMFILAFVADADLCNLSATDSNGINSLQKRVSGISARLHVLWVPKLSLWHIYPPLLRNDRCTPSVLLMEVDSS